MASCPNCHIYQGLWSPLTQTEGGQYICKVNSTHRFTRDRDGNFHTVRSGK